MNLRKLVNSFFLVVLVRQPSKSDLYNKKTIN